MKFFDFIFKRTCKVEKISDDSNTQASALENGSQISNLYLHSNGLFACSDNNKFKLIWRQDSNLNTQDNGHGAGPWELSSS